MASSAFAEVRGLIVRRLREAAGLTQAELAEKAHYGAGGRIALAKVEQGRAEPTPARLEGICAALGITTEQLDQQVASVLVAKPGPRPGGRVENVILGGLGGAEAASNVRRQHAIDVESEGMRRGTQARLDRVTKASNVARDTFVLPFLDLAGRVNGLPTLTVTPQPTGRAVDVPSQVRASVREMSQVAMGIQILRAAQNLGVASKNAAYAAMGTYGKASTGTKIAELYGAVKDNAIMAQFGGGAKDAGGFGVAGGKYALGAIRAAPLVVAAGGLLAVTAAQSRVRAKTEAARLLEVERALESTRAALPQVWAWADAQAEVLTALAAAGAELMPGVEGHVGREGIVEWATLDESAQRNLERAVELATAVLAVDVLPIWELVPPDAEPRADEAAAAWIDAVLQAGRDLTQLGPR